MEYTKEIKVRNKNNKVKIVLNDKYLILKYLFKDKKIKKSDIRSSLISGNSFLILTYDNTIYKYPINTESMQAKEGLKLVINEINNENIIFNSLETLEYCCPLYCFILQFYIVIFEDMVSLFSVCLTVFLFLAIYLIIKFLIKQPLCYNIDKQEIFELSNKKHKQVKRFNISDVILVKKDSKETIYRTKNTSFHFKLENSYKRITYPINFVNAIDNLNISAKKK